MEAASHARLECDVGIRLVAQSENSEVWVSLLLPCFAFALIVPFL